MSEKQDKVGSLIALANLPAEQRSAAAGQLLTPDMSIVPPPGYIPLKLGHVDIPFAVEPFHIIVSGGTGAGKSTTNYQVIENFRARGLPGAIVDRNGDAMSRFWQPGDLIINPFDVRTQLWDLQKEIRYIWDHEALAVQANPDLPNEGRYWSTRAQQTHSDISEQLDALGPLMQTHEQLLHFATKAPVYKADANGKMSLEELLAGTVSGRMFGKGAEKPLSSTLDVLAQNLRSLRYFKGGDFSLREWVHGCDEPGKEKRFVWIVIPNTVYPAIRSVLGLMMSIFISAAQELKYNPHRRVLLGLDELNALGKVEALPEGMNLLRKSGCVLLLDIQSIAQMSDLYGADTAQSMIDNAGTLLMMRSSDPKSNKYFSELIGDQEVMEKGYSDTEARDASGALTNSKTTTRTPKIKPKKLPVEFGQLKPREGYLRVVGTEHEDTKITVPLCRLPTTAAEPFIPREGLERPRAKKLNATGKSNG